MPTKATDARKVGLAVIGTGAAAHTHARAIAAHPRAKLVAVHSRREDAAERLAGAFGCRGTTSFEQILDDPSVDAIVLANEPQRHDMAIAAAGAGKHLLVEKPLAPDLKTGHAIVEAYRGRPLVAAAVFQRRFDGALAAARKILEAGEIGTVRFVDLCDFSHRDRAYYEAGCRWRSEPCGGLVMNRLIHHFDRLVQLFGRVRRVSAHLVDRLDGIPVETEGLIALEFARPITATVRGSSNFPKITGSRLVIVGDDGSVEVRGNEVSVSSDPLAAAPWLGRREHLRRAAKGAPPRTTYTPGGIGDQLSDFLDAIRFGRCSRVTLDDGFYGLRVAIASLQSHHESRHIEIGGAPCATTTG